MDQEQEIISKAGRKAPPPQYFSGNEIIVEVHHEGIDYLVTLQKVNKILPNWTAVHISPA